MGSFLYSNYPSGILWAPSFFIWIAQYILSIIRWSALGWPYLPIYHVRPKCADASKNMGIVCSCRSQSLDPSTALDVNTNSYLGTSKQHVRSTSFCSSSMCSLASIWRNHEKELPLERTSWDSVLLQFRYQRSGKFIPFNDPAYHGHFVCWAKKSCIGFNVSHDHRF